MKWDAQREKSVTVMEQKVLAHTFNLRFFPCIFAPSVHDGHSQLSAGLKCGASRPRGSQLTKNNSDAIWLLPIFVCVC